MLSADESVDENVSETGEEVKELVRFENYDVYELKQNAFLDCVKSGDVPQAQALLTELQSKLQPYQEQAFLLDPYLERLLEPPAQTMREIILYEGDNKMQACVSRLLYTYTKVRGYKLVSRFLPHDVRDLPKLLDTIERMQQGENAWEVVYILLLWLALVVLVPFPLHRKGGSILERVDKAVRPFLSSSGKARDAASIVLGHLYARRDACSALFTHFLQEANNALEAKFSAFLATGVVQTLCEVAQCADAAFICAHYDEIQRVIARVCAPDRARNMLVDRYTTKLESRLAMHLVKQGADDVRVDEHIDALMHSLAHTDSRVRYSAAKGMARITAKLPEKLRLQVFNALLCMLSEHIPGGVPSGVGTNVSHFDTAACDALRRADLHAVSDSTWHGVFLAIAECVRRTPMPAGMYVHILYWVLAGLVFDVRRVTGSTGTAVRDAACYVLWSLARSRDASHALIRVAAIPLTQRIVISVTLDRDVCVRRAASAALQEWVGRTGGIPNGIEILRATDFAAVGPIRRAFLTCAPFIASFDVNRAGLVQHLEDVTLVHWDASVRALGAEALERIVSEAVIAHDVVTHLAPRTRMHDHDAVHGALLALSRIAAKHSNVHGIVLDAALSIPPLLMNTFGAAIITAACCVVAQTCIKDFSDDARIVSLIEMAGARPESHVQDAAVAALHTWRGAFFVHTYIRNMLDAWPESVEKQCTAAKAFGLVDVWPDERRQRLCDVLDSQSSFYAVCVETRCAAAKSLATLPSRATVAALVRGLHDMSTDQRGDIGSWVRVASLESLGSMISEADLAVPDMLGMLMERIDTLRVKAAHVILHVVKTCTIAAKEEVMAVVHTPDELLDAHKAFLKLMPLLGIQPYRSALLSTLANTIGTRSEMARRDAGHAFTTWASGAPPAVVDDIFACLFRRASEHARDNRIVVPIMQTLAILFEGDVHMREGLDNAQLIRIVRFTCHRIAHVNSVPRIFAAIRICTSAMRSAQLALHIYTFLIPLLKHRFPTVRMHTSEAVFELAQDWAIEHDTSELEAALLDTPWATAAPPDLDNAIQNIIQIIYKLLSTLALS